jgi:hypothetical protein
METVTNIGLGVGIAGVAVASIWWLASGRTEKVSPSPTTAWIGVGSAGVSGRF